MQPNVTTDSSTSAIISTKPPASHIFFAAPTLGSIVWSYFPHQEAPAEGEKPVRPKPRPALVVGVWVEDGEVYVLAIPGTTKRTAPEEIYPTEMIIRKSDADYEYTGLSHDTKFNFERKLPLPYNTVYFAIPNKKPGSKVAPTSPRLGTLPFSYKDALEKAAGEAAKMKSVH